MKVCILGPVTTKTDIGGVAVFDEGLADGFRSIGAEAFIGTEQKGLDVPGKVFHIDGKNISTLMEREKPDVIIASLQYGKYFRKLRRFPNKVLFLHGFFNIYNYGVLKALAAVMFQKYMIHYSDYVFSNSCLTRTVNRFVWNMPSDAVIPLGTSHDFIQEALKAPVIHNAANGRLLYTGRLENSKHVDRLILAVKALHEEGISCPLTVAGTGSKAGMLKELAGDDKEITFLGVLPHDELYRLYTENEVFISLCEAESFGITFAEALTGGCKIVCPETGGQTEFLAGYPERVCRCDQESTEDVKRAIKALLGRPVPDLPSAEVCPLYDYSNGAGKILRFFETR